MVRKQVSTHSKDQEKSETPHKTVSKLSCDVAKQSLKGNGKTIDQSITVYNCIPYFIYLITILNVCSGTEGKPAFRSGSIATGERFPAKEWDEIVGTK